KKKPHTEDGLTSSPSRPRCPRRRHHPCRPLPVSSGATHHAPELPTVLSSLPSSQILCSRPLPPARNPIPMARVSSRASPTSRASSRRCEGCHGPAAPHGFIMFLSHPLPFPSLPHLGSFPSCAGQQGGTIASSTSSPWMTPLLCQNR
uniref:Uncharacterized protein n=1 Tax=Triticum urartu TaxID=4572 RepID=A0A8R7K4G1_TRIUA